MRYCHVSEQHPPAPLKGGLFKRPLTPPWPPSRGESLGVILGIETATTICSVGLATSERVLAEISFDIKNIHDHALTESIAQLLRLAKLRAQDLQAIAVSAGPGSFTGLRIGMSVAKGLAFTHNKPTIAVSTLLLQAAAAVSYAEACTRGNSSEACTIVPVIPSRRHEIYTASFRLASPLPELATVESVIKVADFPAVLPARAVLCGHGLTALREAGLLEQLREHFLVPMESARLSGGLTARLGQIKFARGEVTHAETLEPLYVQDFETGPVAPRMQ